MRTGAARGESLVAEIVRLFVLCVLLATGSLAIAQQHAPDSASAPKHQHWHSKPGTIPLAQASRAADSKAPLAQPASTPWMVAR